MDIMTLVIRIFCVIVILIMFSRHTYKIGWKAGYKRSFDSDPENVLFINDDDLEEKWSNR